jgi:hypothetical protein
MNKPIIEVIKNEYKKSAEDICEMNHQFQNLVWHPLIANYESCVDNINASENVIKMIEETQTKPEFQTNKEKNIERYKESKEKSLEKIKKIETVSTIILGIYNTFKTDPSKKIIPRDQEWSFTKIVMTSCWDLLNELAWL